MSNEELLEKAKWDYRDDPIVTWPHLKQDYQVISDSIEVTGGCAMAKVFDDITTEICLYNLDKNWAQIISTPKEHKMTHEEAIKELKRMLGYGLLTKEDNAINYAIRQLKKCEVFDEPREMEVNPWNNGAEKLWVTRKVLGRFNDQFIFEKVFGDIDFIKHAREIKKEPMSFTQWFEQIDNSNIDRNLEYNGIWKDNMLNESIVEYQQYLQQFNK